MVTNWCRYRVYVNQCKTTSIGHKTSGRKMTLVEIWDCNGVDFKTVIRSSQKVTNIVRLWEKMTKVFEKVLTAASSTVCAYIYFEFCFVVLLHYYVHNLVELLYCSDNIDCNSFNENIFQLMNSENFQILLPIYTFNIYHLTN